MSYKKYLAVLPCAALWAALPPKAGAQPFMEQQQQGMVVARDPQTGQLRAPTPAEIRALRPAPASSALRAPPPPTMVTHPGGSRQVRLGERGLVYSVVTRGADGKLAEQCVHGTAAAEKALGAAANAATPAAPHNEEHHHD